jgi:RsiW-degrading membrane proteinase PrsW (M82 family)
MRQLLVSCAVGVIPFFAANIGIIAFHKGSIIHMSKLEWALWTILTSVAMWLVLATFLCLIAFVSRGKRWLFGSLCAVLLCGLPPFIQPHFWSWQFWSVDPLEEPAFWLLVAGSVSTVVALCFAKRRSMLIAHRTPGAQQVP